MGKAKARGKCPLCTLPIVPNGRDTTWDAKAYQTVHTACLDNPGQAATIRRQARDQRKRNAVAATRRRGTRYTQASPVTITRPDGTVERDKAYTPRELRAITKERHPLDEALKQLVRNRDRNACRYCQTTEGPFEYDHVVPVAIGGPTSSRNIVYACTDCNRRKGANTWTPQPLTRHYKHLTTLDTAADLPNEQDENVGHGTRSEHKGAA